MSGNVLAMEKEFEIKVLRDELKKLENENSKLRLLNKELGGDADVSSISDEEIICIEQITKLKELSDIGELSNDDIKKFDLLVKNLKLIRGELKRGKKSGLKKMSNADLIKELK